MRCPLEVSSLAATDPAQPAPRMMESYELDMFRMRDIRISRGEDIRKGSRSEGYICVDNRLGPSGGTVSDRTERGKPPGMELGRATLGSKTGLFWRGLF